MEFELGPKSGRNGDGDDGDLLFASRLSKRLPRDAGELFSLLLPAVRTAEVLKGRRAPAGKRDATGRAEAAV
jgi:hypothetical protein